MAGRLTSFGSSLIVHVILSDMADRAGSRTDRMSGRYINSEIYFQHENLDEEDDGEKPFDTV